MRLDRSAILKDAHKRYRQGLRLGMGWTFARCLKTAWAAAKQRQFEVAAYHAKGRAKRDFIFLIAA